MAYDNDSHATYELRLDAVIAEFLHMQDQGYQVDKQMFLAQHAEFASELEEFFQGIPAFKSVVSLSDEEADDWPREDTSDTRYSVSSLHASGGIGRIYIAQDGDLRRKVALKSIHPRLHHHPSVQARFLREAQITGQLEHPNIVPVYELVRGQDGAVRFYTMRLVRGKTFRSEIRAFFAESSAQDRLAFHRLVAAYLNVCHAVEYAHSRSIIHRDLKPDNVMIGKFGEVALMDWGLAKHVTTVDLESSAVELSAVTAADVSTPNFEPGTPAYMAPEQAKAQSHLIGPRTDVYGLGAILFELLTGDVPHVQRGSQPLRDQIATDASPDPLARRPDASRALAAICRKAMAVEPRGRYPSAQSLADDIERYLADEPISVYREPILKRSTRWVRRHRVAASTIVGISVAVSIATVVWWAVEAAKDRHALEDANQLLGRGDAAYAAGDLEEAARGYSNAQVRTDGRRRLAYLNQRAVQQLGLVEGLLIETQDFDGFRQFVAERLAKSEADMMLGDPKTAAQHCQVILQRFDQDHWQQRLDASKLDRQAVQIVRQDLIGAILILVATKSTDADSSSNDSLEESLTLVSRGTEIHPVSRGVWLLKAEYLAALNRPAEAKGAHQQSLETPAQTAFDFYVQGECERRNRRFYEAIQQYERALQLEPDDFWSHVRLAGCWTHLHQPHRALGHSDHALRLRDDAPWLYAARAVVYADLRLWNDALADLETADRLDPEFYGTSNNRGAVFVRKALEVPSTPEERGALLHSAELEFRRALQQRPSYAGAWNNIGRVHHELAELAASAARSDQAATHFRRAVKAFSAALELDPRSTTALTNRALAKALLGHFADARSDVDQAVHGDPDESSAYLALGQIALAEGESQAGEDSGRNAEVHYRAAIEEFEKAIVLAPHEPAGYLARARARFELMQLAVAENPPAGGILAKAVLADLELAEEFGGDTLPAQERAQMLGMRATARAHTGDYANAVVDYALSLELEPNNAVRRTRRGWALIMAANIGLADFDQILANEGLVDERVRADAHAGRAYLLALGGDHRAAVAAANRAVALAPDHWPTLFNAACSYSLASGTARHELKNARLADQYATRAIALLHESVANGLDDRTTIAQERALVPLCERTEFVELVGQIRVSPGASQTEARSR